MQDVKMTDQRSEARKCGTCIIAGHEMLHILVVLLCYISDRMFNTLLSTNCFDELFFAFDLNVVIV